MKGLNVYFEPFRPPLLPLILSIIPYKLFYLLLTFVFIYLIYINLRNYLYFFLIPLIPFYLYKEGSEILAITFLLLALSFFKKDNLFFLFLSLSLITRYDFIVFLLLKTERLKNFKNLLIFTLPLTLIPLYNLFISNSIAKPILNYLYLNSSIRRFHFFINFLKVFLNNLEFYSFIILFTLILVLLYKNIKDRINLVLIINSVKSFLTFQFRIRYLIPTIALIPFAKVNGKSLKLFVLILFFLSFPILIFNYVGERYYKISYKLCNICKNQTCYSERWVLDNYFCKTKNFKPLELVFLKEFHLEKNKTYIIFNGNIKKVKNIKDCNVTSLPYVKVIKC